MHLNFIPLLSFCLFISVSVSCQDASTPKPATYAIFTEVGGPGMQLSLNFDTRIQGREDGWGIRLGLGTNLGSNPNFFSLPVGVNYLAGEDGNYFEIGGGVTYVHIGSSTDNAGYHIGSKDFYGPAQLFFGNVVLGYRRQPADGGFHFRAGFAPSFGMNMFSMFPYIGVGCSF